MIGPYWGANSPKHFRLSGDIINLTNLPNIAPKKTAAFKYVHKVNKLWNYYLVFFPLLGFRPALA